MKITDSGMPAMNYWEQLFDADEIAGQFGWNNFAESGRQRAIEFGCGYGTFTTRLAECFASVDSFEIEPQMVELTNSRISESARSRVKIHQLDFVGEKLPIPNHSTNVAVLFHMMHLTNPTEFLIRVAKCLQPGGTLAMLHWRCDRETPRGPAMDLRPTNEQYEHWAKTLGATSLDEVPLPNSPHHYACKIVLP